MSLKAGCHCKQCHCKRGNLYFSTVDRGSSLWHGKTMVVAMAGGDPWFYVENGEPKGSDVRILKLLSKKLGFKYELKALPYHNGVVEMVS